MYLKKREKEKEMPDFDSLPTEVDKVDTSTSLDYLDYLR